MAIFDLYSKRKAQAEGSNSDVYQYDLLPDKLRVQLAMIFEEVIGSANRNGGFRNDIRTVYRDLVLILRKEYGARSLNHRNSPLSDSYMEEFMSQILEEQNVDHVLDAIELGCNTIDFIARDYNYRLNDNYDKICDEALNEINVRFKESGVGFGYLGKKIARIDSELLHSDVVKPALMFLSGRMYDGPREEFLSAHSHYRSGKHKQAISECAKALESTMKAICDKREWPYEKGKATAKDLIRVCFDKGLVPSFWDNNLTNLRLLLENGVPTGRNKTSAHGQGSTPVTVKDSVAEYIMHMTASTILFLAKSEEELP
ncbi:STM4504/CBY_0614 family protein [Agrobacterium pusense]|uniref:STM4504/CBY_0614 family protein n=1 Tax=Agrobacterium pusense TaxID=648995 RepID=UPI001AEB02FC|nr:hypothetical protein [Agrobacterium pusense]MBP2614774.1 hypothetical protein [Agrobacterium pusense]